MKKMNIFFKKWIEKLFELSSNYAFKFNLICCSYTQMFTLLLYLGSSPLIDHQTKIQIVLSEKEWIFGL